jgi:diguanylate cyclase (GGDEF)-like protein
MNEKKYSEYVKKLLHDNAIPELPEEYAKDPLFAQIYSELKAIRETTYAFSIGDFSTSIEARGFIPGSLKTLQANLRHLIWQVQMVEKGDFSQEVHFMGDFSTAFNSMVYRFRKSLTELQEKERNLTESEARFKFLASRDSLTGIYNRRSFTELAEVNLTNAMGIASPCCLAMMDIDHFKNFNDTYGHHVGDEALRHVVKVIESSLRKNDFMGRYGGEEFVIFFFDTDEQTGFNIVERLRKKLNDKPLEIENNGSVPIYSSFGVVESSMEDPKDEEYVQNLINDADAALYAAKRTGRNRVVVYNSEFKNAPPVQ